MSIRLVNNGLIALAFVVLNKPHAASAQLAKFGEPGCEQCKAGEYRQRVTEIIPSGNEIHGTDDPPCGDQPDLVKTLGSTVITAAKTMGGAVDPKSISGAIGNVSNALGIGGSVGSILGRAGEQYARCKAVCVIVPEDAVVTATHYQINRLYPDNTPPGTMEVVDPTAAHVDYAHIFPPVKKTGAVCSIVSNWAGGYQRTVIMDAFFTSPTPPIEIR